MYTKCEQQENAYQIYTKYIQSGYNTNANKTSRVVCGSSGGACGSSRTLCWSWGGFLEEAEAFSLAANRNFVCASAEIVLEESVCSKLVCCLWMLGGCLWKLGGFLWRLEACSFTNWNVYALPSLLFWALRPFKDKGGSFLCQKIENHTLYLQTTPGTQN